MRKEVKEESALVTVQMGVTLNMDNYESFRLNIGITYPCKPEDKAVDSMIEKLHSKIVRELDKRIKGIRKNGTKGYFEEI